MEISDEKGHPLPLQLEETRDGSHTLIRTDLDESYHSHRGARSESIHVFIEAGLDHLVQKKAKPLIRVFEVGFGTGLNALLSWEYAERQRVEVDYHTIEPFPVPLEMVTQLNYATDEQTGTFLEMHRLSWEEPHGLGAHFSFTKYRSRLEDFDAEISWDLIFMDAFAPSKQAEMWWPANLSKCFGLLNPGGALVTYCAQGQFKRDLKTCGFEVEVLPGALGKKEMVRAWKP